MLLGLLDRLATDDETTRLDALKAFVAADPQVNPPRAMVDEIMCLEHLRKLTNAWVKELHAGLQSGVDADRVYVLARWAASYALDAYGWRE